MHIKVKVFPKSKKNEVVKKSEDAYVVYTKAESERGQANEAVQKLLSEFLHTPSHNLRLIKGSKSPSKIFLLK